MYIAKLSKETFAQAIKEIKTVVIPIGSIEAHGSHCPLSTDIIVPEHILSLMEETHSDKILIAPSVNYGYTPSLAYFPGTVHISGETLTNYVFELAQGWVKWGAEYIILFNGHGGNTAALTLVANKVAELGATCVLVNWWQNYSKEILEICDAQGHAGEDETSVVLAIDPDLVDMSKAGVHDKQLMASIFAPDAIHYSYPDALNGDARKASVEKGEAIYEAVCQSFAKMLERLWAKDWTDKKAI